eukprot:TRINITY_DN1094_c3_g1_i1.p1 TRINITY_DN1094_c3_g1~~TRINITY_DN1094_c3_g1_i1.p1  ORF type:complete len:992 (+),score=180.38 TRINITY_DN1094_c3_g1_i1:177-2978(+)
MCQERPLERSVTVCQERSLTMTVEEIQTEEQKADTMINQLFQKTVMPAERPSASVSLSPPESPVHKVPVQGTPPREASLSKLVGHAAEAVVTPVIPKSYSSKQMLHKGYENQATTWNATDSLHGMVRRGDFHGLKAALTQNPQDACVKDDLGANILHVSLLINGAKQRQIACWLLDNHPKLLSDPYDSEGFAGEVALHFPIVHRDAALARLLLGRYPQALFCRAKGSFFREPKEGCYFGEYPLLFSVCTNQPDLVSTFLEVGVRALGLSKNAHLKFRDIDRNTALHLCVYHNLPDMYDFIEELWKKHCPEILEEGTEELRNSQGYTPFTLSAKLGKQEIFNHLLQRCSITEWKYGPVNCRKVALTELDRPVSHEGAKRKGVLQILEEEQHSHLLMHPLILQLQQYKWDTFAGRYFINRFCVVCAFIEVFFVASVLKSDTRADSDLSAGVVLASLVTGFTVWYSAVALSRNLPLAAQPDWPAHVCIFLATSLATVSYFIPSVALYSESIVVLGALWKAMREMKEMYSDSIVDYFSCKGAQLMENVISLTFSCLILAAVCSRYYDAPMAEDLSLAFASLALWSYVLWLLLGFRMTGPFVIMIWKMLCSDILRFLLIFAAFLFGFAQTFFILLDESGFESFVRRVHVCFVALLGQAELSHEESNKFPVLSTTLLLMYVLLVSILLLNLLVAMMSSTYAEIQEEAEKVWRLQWTRLIFSIESEMSPEAKQSDKNTYWAVMDSPTGMKRYFVLPMKAGEEEVKRFHDEVNPFKGRRPPAVVASELDGHKELEDLLEDPSIDAAYGDDYSRAFLETYVGSVTQDVIKSAAAVFNHGTANPELVQLLVGIAFTQSGPDLLGLLSHHYFGCPLPKNLQKARSARFLASIFDVKTIPVSEVRSLLSSFATQTPALAIESTPSFSNFPAVRVQSASLPTEATS